MACVVAGCRKYQACAHLPHVCTQVKWLCLQLFPNRQNSSMKDQKSTKKEIAEHYDRGNDFFNAFLGPSMVYTSGVFRGIKQSLEEAQVNKMDMICQKLGVSF